MIKISMRNWTLKPRIAGNHVLWTGMERSGIRKRRLKGQRPCVVGWKAHSMVFGVWFQPKEPAKFAERFRGSDGIISAFEREMGYTSPALHCGESIPRDVGGGPEGLVSHFQEPV